MTSWVGELLIGVTRETARSLGGQIEDQIRAAIRTGALHANSPLPSTRELAAQLGVSRPIVVEAYAQLATEGYLSVRQGARPIVSPAAVVSEPAATGSGAGGLAPRFDLRPATPDLSSFPKRAWVRATRRALDGMSNDDFGYREPEGCEALRQAVAEYLGRVRGVVAHPRQVVITSGFAQGRWLACRALKAVGALRLALEDPGYSEWDFARHADLAFVPVPVDAEGLRVDALRASGADCLMVTPAHQFPTGAVMSGPRRAALLEWLRDSNAYAVEDDYDAEFRYDRAPVGALQGLQPDRVIYAGTTSKTLAPALRLGWLVAPDTLIETILAERRAVDSGCPRIEQHALADLMLSGEFDRHLRRMRRIYKARRNAMIQALAEHAPSVEVSGAAAGLHLTVRCAEGVDAALLQERAAARGLAITMMADHSLLPRAGRPVLLLGYANHDEARIRTSVRALAAALNAASRKRGRAAP